MQRSVPRRVAERPDPLTWGIDELMTLEEAVSLMWPDGPLTVSSLRTAIRNRQLEVAEIARKFFVTRRSLMTMTACKTLRRELP